MKPTKDPSDFKLRSRSSLVRRALTSVVRILNMFRFWKWTEYEYGIVLFGPNYSNILNSEQILIVSIDNLDQILNTKYIQVLKMDWIRISNTTIRIRSLLFEPWPSPWNTPLTWSSSRSSFSLTTLLWGKSRPSGSSASYFSSGRSDLWCMGLFLARARPRPCPVVALWG